MTQTVILHGAYARQEAHRLIDHALDGHVVTVSPPKRNLDQNAKLWAMLSDISRAKPNGLHYVPEVWKSLFMHALQHEVRFVHALDGSGPFPIGFSTSRLTKSQMADLITVIHEYGDRHGVRWTDPQERASA